MTPGQAARAEVETLTALRGLAALWVVLYHFENRLSDVPGTWIISQGDVAVDIFFTLSGFILVYVYGTRYDTWSFLKKRFARLYPVHFVTLMLYLLMVAASFVAGIEANADVTLFEFVMHLFAVHGWGVTDRLALNYPSWSISAEFAAYLFFPLLTPFFLKARLPLALAVSVALFVACVLIADALGRPLTARSYDLSPLRILPEFVFGMLAARMALAGQLARLPVLLLALLLFTAGLVMNAPLMIVIASPIGIAALFLYDRKVPAWLRYLGLVSYSLYMVHALVEIGGFRVMEMLLGTADLPLWTLFAMTGIALIMASLLYHGVEEPGRKWVMSRLAPRTRS